MLEGPQTQRLVKQEIPSVGENTEIGHVVASFRCKTKYLAFHVETVFVLFAAKTAAKDVFNSNKGEEGRQDWKIFYTNNLQSISLREGTLRLAH